MLKKDKWFAAMPRRLLCALSFAILFFQGVFPADAVYLCNPAHGANPEVAIEACNQEISAGRSLDVAYFDRGLNWAKKKDVDKAIDDYNHALAINPNYQDAYIARGNAWKDKGDPEQARTDYDRAIAIDPSKAGLAYFARGNYWKDKDQLQKAIDDYDRAIDLMPMYTNAYMSRGFLHFARNDFTKAIADYERALAIDPNNNLAKINKADAERLQKQFGGAVPKTEDFGGPPEPAAQTITRWGLIGAWAADCSAPLDEDHSRQTYKIDPNGRIIHEYNFGSHTQQREIVSAAISEIGSLNVKEVFQSVQREYGYMKQTDSSLRIIYNRNEKNEYTVKEGIILGSGKPTVPQSRCN